MTSILHRPRVAIIDYGMGNLFSVQRACESAGLAAVITSAVPEVMDSDGAILPGVGAFGDAVGNLRDLGLVDTIIAFIESGKPLMGICLGMQLLMSESAEFGKHAGLGIINGCVERFSAIEAHKKIKIPHVGWNSIVPSPSGAEHAWSGTPLSGITGGEMFYFTHSYCAVPRDRGVVLSVTEYDGVTYCSSILQKNVFACQFHPEKSGLNGLQVYRSWAAMIAQRNGE